MLATNNDVIHMRAVVERMELGTDYRIIWSSLATHVDVEETCNYNGYSPVAVIHAGLIGDFVMLARAKGFYTKIKGNNFQKSYFFS